MLIKPHYLFVYGTLRQKNNHDNYQMLERYATYISNASFQGRLYKIDYYPGVVPSNNSSDLVQGEVYRLNEPELVLSELDHYEECSPGFNKPSEYLREIHPVRLSNGETVPAWIYIYNWSADNLEWMPSGDFLKTYLGGE